MKIRVVIAILFMLAQTHIQASHECDSKKLGHWFGDLQLAEAKEFARFGRSIPECDDEDDDGGYQCKHADDLAKVSFEIEQCLQERAWDELKYDETMEYNAFNVMRSGIRARDRHIRWHVLGKIYLLCEVPELLTRVGRTSCRTEVEDAVLITLNEDKDRLNRQLALEILTRGYGTTRAIDVLRGVAESAGEPKGECPRLLENEAKDMDRVESEFDEGRLDCEKTLALEAIERIRSAANGS